MTAMTWQTSTWLPKVRPSKWTRTRKKVDGAAWWKVKTSRNLEQCLLLELWLQRTSGTTAASVVLESRAGR